MCEIDADVKGEKSFSNIYRRKVVKVTLGKHKNFRWIFLNLISIFVLLNKFFFIKVNLTDDNACGSKSWEAICVNFSNTRVRKMIFPELNCTFMYFTFKLYVGTSIYSRWKKIFFSFGFLWNLQAMRWKIFLLYQWKKIFMRENFLMKHKRMKNNPTDNILVMKNEI